MTLFSEFHLGDTCVRYHVSPGNDSPPSLSLLPRSHADAGTTPREHLDGAHIVHLPKSWLPFRARERFPLVHIQVQGEPSSGGFSQGRTLLGSPLAHALRLVDQSCDTHGDRTTILTRLKTPDGLIITHTLHHLAGEGVLTAQVNILNAGSDARTLDLLTSFALDGITPFATDDAPNRLHLHRFRSAWSAEGRATDQSVEELNLERSWSGYGVRSERFGQVGSMPTNGWFPLAVIEDRPAGVFWGAKLAHPGSWQIEVYRRGDELSLAGGQADRLFGHWSKRLAPGESFTAPEAFLATSSEGLDDICHRLNEPSVRAFKRQPEVERSLPVVFNEWCTSWGNPSHRNIIELADRLQGSGAKYLVIDDGWAERPGPGIQQNGDWILNRSAFPDGLRATADAIRQRGLIPGVWFEFEVVNAGAKAWEQTAHHLHRDGVPLQVGTRRYWDFRDPWVHEYLGEKVLHFLRENNLGYLKVDYNDSLGMGCDGGESPGEALRQHLEGVQRFFRRLRTELPDLVIENCSSGGHRAEPSMMAITAMTSFSDAHESTDIPVIAANLHRLISATQNQIWAVVRKDDTLQRLSYSLAATFLGRICLSGDVHELSANAWTFVHKAIGLYQQVAPLIAAGRFTRQGETSPAYQHLEGWQAAVCDAGSRLGAMVVWHAFNQPPSQPIRIQLPTSARPAGNDSTAETTGGQKPRWRIEQELSDAPTLARIEGSELILPALRAWSGGVVRLRDDPS